VLRAVLVGLVVAAAAIGTASTAAAEPSLVASAGAGGIPTSPGPFLECPKGSYQASSGDCVESPDQNTSGATAVCCDGSDSHSEHRSGTCSGHGGVCQWLTTAGAGYSDNPDNGPVDNSPDARFLWLLTDPTDNDHP
jgi:hypothetical protein